MQKKSSRVIQNIILIVAFILGIAYILFVTIHNYINNKVDPINKDELMTIKISIDDELYQELYSSPEDENYISVDVEINGKEFKNCGFRTKGSSVYEVVRATDNPTRFGYRLELDYYVKDQNYDGIKKFYLNNGALDPTYIKEMIGYDVYEKAGVKTPKRALSELTINGKNDGIYTIVELPEEDFLQRNYGSNYGIIYKTKITEKTAPDNESSLVYKDDNIETYLPIYNCEKFGRSFTKTDATNIVNALKAISNNENLEEYVNISDTIDYFVGSFFLPNEDSYISESFRNFYIYQSGKQITLLPYDLNLYFRYNDSVNKPVLYYDIYKYTENKPLIYNILSNTEYQNIYIERMYKLLDALSEDDYLIKRIDLYSSLITDSVQTNENNWYDYETFSTAIETFKIAMEARIRSVTKQLDSGNCNEYVDYEPYIDKYLINDYYNP
jgi:spore coat protein CotH